MSTPAFTPRDGGHPYPPVAFDNSPAATARLAEATRDWPRPPAEPRYHSVGELMDAQAAAGAAPPLTVRVPGKSLDRHRPAETFPAFGVPAGPAPEPVEPPAAEPFPGWLRDFFLSLLDDAAYGIGEALDKPCRLDQHSAAGWCESCQGLYERAGRYARLQEVLKSAPDSGSAVRTLLAEGWR